MAACPAAARPVCFLTRVPGALTRCDLLTPVAVRCKDAVKAREVHARLGHQRRQPCDEIQGLEEDMGRAISIRCLEPVAHLALGCP